MRVKGEGKWGSDWSLLAANRAPEWSGDLSCMMSKLLECWGVQVGEAIRYHKVCLKFAQ